MATLVAAFNADLSALRCAQLELAVGMKAAEGRLLLLLRELGVLQVRLYVRARACACVCVCLCVTVATSHGVCQACPVHDGTQHTHGCSTHHTTRAAHHAPHTHTHAPAAQEAAARERVLDAKRDAKLAEAAGLAAKLAELDDAAADKRTEGEAAAARKAAVAGELEVLLTGAAASGGGAGGGGGGAKSSSGSGGGGGGGGAGAQALGAHEGHREALAKIFHACVSCAAAGTHACC
jgi:hypothetical protein